MMSRLEQDTYDLILLDLNLGVEDGLDLLRELHARGRSRIIVISGRKNPVDRVVGLELGRRLCMQAVSSARSLGARQESVALVPADEARKCRLRAGL